VKAVSGKAFAKLLEKKGWNCQRINGSHHIYTSEHSAARIALPIHGNTTLKIGLLRHFMNVAGIDETEL
jgi:predicted RNA binding protein YcfA (HicA-like mRNA interferase family)